MKINRDDPKWTAYVLGELSEAENAEVAQLLESSEEAREFVEELRMATTMLRDELAQAEAPALLPEQRRAIYAAAGQGERSGRVRWMSLRPVTVAVGIAMSVLIVAAISISTMPSLLRSRQASSPMLQGAISEQVPVEQAANRPEVDKPIAPLRYQSAPPANAAVVDPGEPSSPATELADAVAPSADLERETQVQTLNKVDSFSRSPEPPLPQSAQSSVADQAAAEARRTSGVQQAESRKEAAQFVETPPPTAPGVLGVERPRLLGGSGAGAGVGPGSKTEVVVDPAVVVIPPPQNLDQAFVLPVVPDRRDRPIAPPPSQTEAYDRITDNPFIRVTQNPLSTFSIDVDTASYANMRRFLTQRQMPPKDSVRIEEMVNYFSYDYPQPTGEHPIAAQMEVASAPWSPQHRLVRIAIKGREMDARRRPSSNLVFLIDVSGSMQPPERLPLLKSALKLLVDRLTENDRVSIVVYAGGSGTALPPTSGDKKEVIMEAIDRLRANGSTNGAQGIQLAYNTAVSNFIRGGVNRVILATDGDFNVGITNQGDLVRLIEDRARSGVFLSVFGFGMGNLKDSTLEKLADSGNGHYAYIDSIAEARKVLVEEMGSTLVTIAKDVKLQIEFNPAQVSAYRLIGYENRLLRDEDFNNDQRDAGDMGSGHAVTALFEIVPPGVDLAVPGVDPLKYQPAPPQPARAPAVSREMLNLKIRYKEPDRDQSKLFETSLVDRGNSFQNASTDFRFAASVAAFGMILRDSPYKGDIGVDAVLRMAQQSQGSDRGGYRREFLNLIQQARSIGRLP